MGQRLVPGVEVEYAGQCWRVHRPLGPDAVLLRNDAGEITSVDPVRVSLPTAAALDPPPATQVEQHYTDAQWIEAGCRRDRLEVLARLSSRTVLDVDAATRELGLKRRRLAERSGQTLRHLAQGLLLPPAFGSDTISGTVEDLLLQDGRFLLPRRGRGGQERTPALLQYCPCCLREDSQPYFRRGWCFIHVSACADHRCRLHDRCWRCASPIAPFDQRTLDPASSCACCGAILTDAPVIPATGTAQRQRSLTAMLYHVATKVTASEQSMHLDALAASLAACARAGVEQRERALRELSSSTWKSWFGQPARQAHEETL